jgi:cobaltochelatase CobT
MAQRQPIAFLSYVRSDDNHDGGRITAFRERLEGEVRMQTGRPFAIFQDRNDIAWGQQWEDQINRSLAGVAFLIPILTPSFFESPACRNEFQTFSLKEKTLGVDRLILPLYYVTCDQLGEEYIIKSDEIADILRTRNWTDWRQYRFKQFGDEDVAGALANMASMIKSSIKELDAIGIAAKGHQLIAWSELPRSDLPKAVPEQDIPSFEKKIESPLEDTPSEPSYKIAELNPSVGASKSIGEVAQTSSYYAYTTRFDEIIDASELADQAELLGLYRYVSTFTASFKKLFGPELAAKLSNFRSEVPEPPLAVTLLIDNSGSLRGKRIIDAAAWCLLIVEWMERLGIPTEILAFTTRAWKGGQSRELWLANGTPWKPGRLNDLRHLVYKSFSASAEISAPNFGVMAREGLLKENIDGEALLWASSRLENHPAKKKILFVLSDGAPIDDSTLSVNPGNFLEQHLRSVVSDLSKRITLYAIGYNAATYYPNSVAAQDNSSLGVHFFDTLTNDRSFNEFWKNDSKS